jgi:hypothetical protein
MTSESKAARQNAAVYSPRDRRGDVRRQAPPERKRRAYEEIFVEKLLTEEGTLRGRSRHHARRVLAAARREHGEALDRCIDKLDVVRDRHPDGQVRVVSYRREPRPLDGHEGIAKYSRWARHPDGPERVVLSCHRSVSWYPTRLARTLRERIEKNSQRSVEWVGTRHFAAMSCPAWGQWRRLGGISIATADYGPHLAAFLGSLMEGRSLRSLRQARWLGALLEDTSKNIPVSPDNRWSGSMRWHPGWLRQFLDLCPWLADALSAWRADLERRHGAALDARLAAAARDSRGGHPCHIDRTR